MVSHHVVSIVLEEGRVGAPDYMFVTLVVQKVGVKYGHVE